MEHNAPHHPAVVSHSLSGNGVSLAVVGLSMTRWYLSSKLYTICYLHSCYTPLHGAFNVWPTAPMVTVPIPLSPVEPFFVIFALWTPTL